MYVLIHNLLNVLVQIGNKMGFKRKKKQIKHIANFVYKPLLLQMLEKEVM
jgi:hypothetical protein